ncbi:MAG: ankyrin repeat domain-containing protein [Proteobacteria bacterium]|nr:ankyrin repeat domain-containing protein [Pseudomonadota bacterium]
MSTTYQSGDTALHIAALNGRTALVKALVDKGADIGAIDGNGKTPLMLAVREKRKDVEQILIKGRKEARPSVHVHKTPQVPNV